MRPDCSFALALVLAAFSAEGTHPAAEDYVRWVDPLIGTVGEGNTIPGAAYPFGMVQPGPDSGTRVWCSGYKHTDKTIRGISQTHLNGTGCPAMGDILLMPYAGETDGIDYGSAYSDQRCSPDRYAVRFDRFATHAEATCSERVSYLNFTYENAGARKVFVDCASTLLQGWRAKHGPTVPQAEFVLSDDRTEISGSRTVTGWTTYRLYYVVKFDRPWTACVRQPSNAFEGQGDRFDVTFGTEGGVGVRVALSTVSVDGARGNLAAEPAGATFASVAAANRRAWNDIFARAVLAKGTDEQKASWYTALYRLCIQPNNIADADGRFCGADGKVASAPCGRYYSTLSLWDTYRAAHPLYTILVPERVEEFVETMMLHHAAHGHLPVWSLWGKESHDMIGIHSIPVLVDAWAKGFRKTDGKKLLDAMVTSMTANDKEWPSLGWNSTWENGYIPCEPGVFEEIYARSGNVSRTLEQAYDWWCIAHMAEMLGDERGRREASKWAGTWTNIFDTTVGFARPRLPKMPRAPRLNDGAKFLEPFDPRVARAPGEFWSDYTEANGWIYTWHVFQDPMRLVELMGGREKTLAKLDEFFATPPLKAWRGSENNDEGGASEDGCIKDGQIGQYWHGNEPSHHIVYFYALMGVPEKTRKLVHAICRDAYKSRPDGLCGNDDCGQMSAWYLFSMMGFYPFNPCDDGYVLGAPQAEEVQLTVPGGKKLTIRAKGLSEESVCLKSVSLNGMRLSASRLKHGQLLSGGELVFEWEKNR